MITSLSVDSTRLNEILWNALLFTSKTGVTEGKILFSIRTGQHWNLSVFACDDFIVVRDHVVFSLPLDEENQAVMIEDQQFVLSVADVKALEAESRKATGLIEFAIVNDKLTILEQEFTIEYPAQVWGDLTELISSAENFPDGAVANTFYLNPERLKQIPRMKIEGHADKDKRDHPVCFRYGGVDDQVMLAFKHGPSVTGLITSMDESVLRDRGVVTWDHKPETWSEFSAAVEPESESSTLSVIDGNVIAEYSEYDPADDLEDPPWDVDGPTNIDTNDGKGYDLPQEILDQEEDLQGVRKEHWKPTRVEYTDAVDPNITPAHVNEKEHTTYGF